MPRPARSSALDHVVVIMSENRSSGHLLGRLLGGEALLAKVHDAIRSSPA
jgi:phospholipase C